MQSMKYGYILLQSYTFDFWRLTETVQDDAVAEGPMIS